MSIKFVFEDIKAFKLDRKLLKNWLTETIKFEGKSVGDIIYIFCSDSYLLKINKEYLNHDYYTDIITFDYVTNKLISGDIFVSYDRVVENSSIYDVSITNELCRVMIHGILHLLGYKDKSDKDQLIMREKENYYLNILDVN
jgi:metalloprotein, YbeY/UPF0054 family